MAPYKLRPDFGRVLERLLAGFLDPFGNQGASGSRQMAEILAREASLEHEQENQNRVSKKEGLFLKPREL